MTVKEIENLDLLNPELVLTDWINGDGSPIRVSIHYDTKTHIAYQLDHDKKRFRSACGETVAKYGDWVEFKNL